MRERTNKRMNEQETFPKFVNCNQAAIFTFNSV